VLGIVPDKVASEIGLAAQRIEDRLLDRLLGEQTDVRDGVLLPDPVVPVLALGVEVVPPVERLVDREARRGKGEPRPRGRRVRDENPEGRIVLEPRRDSRGKPMNATSRPCAAPSNEMRSAVTQSTPPSTSAKERRSSMTPMSGLGMAFG